MVFKPIKFQTTYSLGLEAKVVRESQEVTIDRYRLWASWIVQK